MSIITALKQIFPSTRAAEVEDRIYSLDGAPTYLEELDGLHVPAFFATDVGARPSQVARLERLLLVNGATLVR